ncbi:MAG: ribokinase [Candidatus Izemoplasmatales bacterium]|nr:ribokinase [Candidatus Izemoplasmatales bacterium]
MSILVVGSFIVDLVVKTDNLPKTGETVFGNSFQVFLGGKGANQAVAARRLGSEVFMTGMVGSDSYGEKFETLFTQEGINFSYVYKCNSSTGIGSVQVDKTGQNRIVMVPSANLRYKAEDLLKVEALFEEVNVVMTQLEMNMDVIELTAKLAKKHHKIFILNPAPMQPLSDELLSNVDYLTPNETELKSLSPNEKCDSLESMICACNLLIKKGVKNVIVTLGDKGCLFVNHEIKKVFPTYKVNVVDTVAAGDSFNGALAHCLNVSSPIETALLYANVVGALTVQKEGAIPSLPTKEEVIKFIDNLHN